jgi:hypothetical protein
MHFAAIAGIDEATSHLVSVGMTLGTHDASRYDTRHWDTDFLDAFDRHTERVESGRYQVCIIGQVSEFTKD